MKYIIFKVLSIIAGLAALYGFVSKEISDEKSTIIFIISLLLYIIGELNNPNRNK